MQAHTCIAQRREVLRAQFATAKTVEADGDAHAALSRFNQDFLQLIADLVFEDNEGLQQDFTLGLAQRFKHSWKVFLAVLQQFDAIVTVPTILDVNHCGLAHRRRRGDVFDPGFFHQWAGHSSISTDSGAWSERCDQGRAASTCGWLALRLRT